MLMKDLVLFESQLTGQLFANFSSVSQDISLIELPSAGTVLYGIASALAAASRTSTSLQLNRRFFEFKRVRLAPGDMFF